MYVCMYYAALDAYYNTSQTIDKLSMPTALSITPALFHKFFQTHFYRKFSGDFYRKSFSFHLKFFFLNFFFKFLTSLTNNIFVY